MNNNDTHANSPFVVNVIVVALAVISIVGLFGLIYLIEKKTDANQLTALLGLVGPAVGSLSSMLCQTRTVPNVTVTEKPKDEENNTSNTIVPGVSS